MTKIRKKTKHELEMEALKNYHKIVMETPELRKEILTEIGVFEKISDGKLVPTEGYRHLFE